MLTSVFHEFGSQRKFLLSQARNSPCSCFLQGQLAEHKPVCHAELQHKLFIVARCDAAQCKAASD